MAPSVLPADSPSSPGWTARPKVYMLDNFHASAISYCKELFDTVLPTDPEHANWRANAQYLLVRSSYVTAADIAACPKLKIIVRHGVGIDRIDAEACRERGISIINTPGVNARSVAELVLTLTLSVARELPTIGVKQSQGLVVPKESCSGLLLHRKTIGIVGMGNIGACVADIFRGAFDASVIAYDPYAPTDAWPATPHLRAKRLEDILGVCHVLTIHVPLTPETRGLISYDQLRRMKPTAILVNASRGGVVNEKDLERALGEGLIWGAGLDCHEQEPPTLEGYENLWQYRVASTPHVGATTLETVAATGIAAVQRLHDYLHKGNVNPVNSQ